MPSKSEAQARLMAMAAHDPAAAKRVGVPQTVAKDFNTSDTGTPLLSHAMRKQKARADALRKRAKAPPAMPPDNDEMGSG